MGIRFYCCALCLSPWLLTSSMERLVSASLTVYFFEIHLGPQSGNKKRHHWLTFYYMISHYI